MLLQELKYAIRILQGQIKINLLWQMRSWRRAGARRVRCGPQRVIGDRILPRAASAALVIPRGLVIRLRRGVKSGEDAFEIRRKLKIFLDDEGRVRIVDKIIFRDAVVLDRIANDP